LTETTTISQSAEPEVQLDLFENYLCSVCGGANGLHTYTCTYYDTDGRQRAMNNHNEEKLKESFQGIMNKFDMIDRGFDRLERSLFGLFILIPVVTVASVVFIR
jgi:hypothetical protein